ncbi:reverse transcriptase domain-containing protein [Barnesiella intestinihominis]|uniref:RNA-directed DNA polymerase n=1 Tax=Barnesiella intestinihominis TaxID=487174 RepID=UPI003AF8FD4E
MTATKDKAYADRLLEDVFSAYFKARKHKRNTSSQLEFEMDLESNLVRLYEELSKGSYKPGPSYCFIVDHPVKREVFASQFRDRVVHHLLYDYINPIFEKRFIHDCYSCREGKGTSAGIDRIEHHIRSCTQNYTTPAWILKLDLRGYFMSIDKTILYNIVSTTLCKHWSKNPSTSQTPCSDPDFIDYLVRSIIFNDPRENVIIRNHASKWDGLPLSKSLLHSHTDKGLPIGDLTSQLFSNIYMDVFDEYVKRSLRIRHYGRYVDDFYVVHPSKGYLTELIGVFRRFLEERLGLTLHPGKIYLQLCRKGVPYLGAFIMPHRRYPSRRSVTQFHKAMSEICSELQRATPSSGVLCRVRASINSYLGYLGHFRSHRIVCKRVDNSLITKYFIYSPSLNKVIIKTKPPTNNHNIKKSGNIIQSA